MGLSGDPCILNGTLTKGGAFQMDRTTAKIYHEVLAGIPIVYTPDPVSVLILGGGDGCAAEVALRFPVKEVVVVDHDPRMTRLASSHEVLLEMNKGSLLDPRVSVVNTDAAQFMASPQARPWDVIIMDFTATDGTTGIDSHAFWEHVESNLNPSGSWSRVYDFPPRMLTTWCSTRVRFIQALGESFLLAIRSPHHRYGDASLFSALPLAAVDAVVDIPPMGRREVYARSLLP